ncbi:MAG: acetyltransferase [Bacteroidales bacterium]|nr:acetyltransferase [Bacteroidales bacterium]MBQ9311686.1 acetyltransferase [Bacteroidales bacterium]
MKDIAIFGVGGFGREVLALIKDINKVTPTWNIVGFFDDGYEKGVMVNGYPNLGKTDDLNQWDKPLSLAISIGSPVIKKKILNKIYNPQIEYPTLIHPSVWIGEKEFVEIGKGCIICAGVMITTNVQIKDFVILNLQCTVGHDTVINEYASFMPSVNISGEVNIGEGVYVGTGAKIINQQEIGEYTIVGAGAVVTKTLPEHCTVVGVPAKPIKCSIEIVDNQNNKTFLEKKK